MEQFSAITLVAIINNDLLRKSNAVVCLEGDGYSRLDKTVEVFKDRLAEHIIVSGGYNNPPFSIPAGILAKELLKKGISEDRVIVEEKSRDTYEQGREVMEILKERKWRSIILVASHFHQPRAYLTFLKAMKDANITIQIFNAPVRELSWFEKTSAGNSRLELLEVEFEKIEEYQKKGHVASIKEAIDYQQWKERRNANSYNN